jgi:hypothetical protein
MGIDDAIYLFVMYLLLLLAWAASYLFPPRFTDLMTSLLSRGRAFTTAPVG